MNPREVINPFEVRVWLLHRLQYAPRKEQEAGPMEPETSPSSPQSDPESPLYRKYRKERRPPPLRESKSSVQDTCGKESPDANNGDEIFPATDSRHDESEEVAGEADIRDRDLPKESGLARGNASTLSPLGAQLPIDPVGQDMKPASQSSTPKVQAEVIDTTLVAAIAMVAPSTSNKARDMHVVKSIQSQVHSIPLPVFLEQFSVG
jgi:hypothetical protein